MVAVQHLTGVYMAERRDVERFMLLHGGIYTAMLWIGFVLLGSVLPLVLLLTPAIDRSPALLPVTAVLVVLGGLALLYSLIIGGEAFPLELFPARRSRRTVRRAGEPLPSKTCRSCSSRWAASALPGVIVCMGTWVLPLLPDRVGAETPG